MKDVLNFVFEKIPIGVVVFKKDMSVRFVNKKGDHFLRRYSPPEEVETIVKRMFSAIAESRVNELFPGEVWLERSVQGSSSRWIFRFYICDDREPLVSVFIIEKALSEKVDVNVVRRQYRLTRRETDVLRGVLDGLKNIEIAEVLEISDQTVKDHLSNIYEKVGVSNRFGLARMLLSSSDMIETQFGNQEE